MLKCACCLRQGCVQALKCMLLTLEQMKGQANVWAGIETQEKAKLVFGFHDMAYHPEMIQQPALLKGTGPDQSKCISVVSIIALTSIW